MVRRLRKTKKSQKFNYNKNRKRANQNSRGTGKIKCLEIRRALDPQKNLATNIKEMGLVYDVNKSIPVPNSKQERKKLAKYVNGFLEEDASDAEVDLESKFPKIHVTQQLEKDANEHGESRFRLPKGHVKFTTDMIDNYGFDYKAMSRDIRNYDQETWRQFRKRVRKFLSIPEQSVPYLERKGWLDCDMSDPSDPRWKEYCTDDEEC
ncbi:nucleolar protein 16 [Toxorhynchites rutilus septentrionalis]|uniref:nucleolar protein 16 n=1 Tax=Toxorhynchites rutilus septentrionalis TaxID=329112 RepID=UPI0024799505|nr:nucleolar protein 16 [Toxorhynchites rutilus septentrionalis]